MDGFVEEYELYLSADRIERIKPFIDQFVQRLDAATEALGINANDTADTKKQQKAKLFLLKAKLLDLLPEY